MAMRRNALERDKTAKLRGDVTRTAERFREHQKVCYDCRPGTDFPKRACERGWTMAKEATRAANVLSVAQAGDAGSGPSVQEKLW